VTGPAPRIVLLDLNYTLCAAGFDDPVSRLPLARRVAVETYRGWLVDLLRPRRVLLLTARPDRWREATLARIAAECGGWRPEAAFFNVHALPPPDAKERALLGEVFPRWGEDGAAYLGIESNPRTRAMYARHGIASVAADGAAAALAEG
jgi:hypothetical protein